jgi:hypothetical protein
MRLGQSIVGLALRYGGTIVAVIALGATGINLYVLETNEHYKSNLRVPTEHASAVDPTPALAAWYTSEGRWIALSVATVLALTTATRVRWARLLASRLALVAVCLLLAAALGQFVSAAEENRLQLTGIFAGLAALVLAAAVALAFGAAGWYDAVAIAVVAGAGILHLVMMDTLSREIHLELLTPGLGYLLAAFSVFVAVTGAKTLQRTTPTRSHRNDSSAS